MKIVLDSTILVRAFDNSGGLSRHLLQIILDGEHTLVSSGEILAETSRVLRYARMRSRHGMADEIVYDYVMMLRSVARMVRPDPTLIAPIRDANDVVVVQTAIGGGADIICTVDNDFFMPPADAFLRAANVRVLTDAELMRLLRS